MNYNKFFELAKKENIEVSEISASRSESLSITVFHKEIEKYSLSNQSTISARGIYNGKLGVASTEKLSNDAFVDLINDIKSAASLVEKEEEPIIFKGSKKYCKKSVYNKELANVKVDTKIAKLFEIEKKAYAYDNRVSEVQVSYKEAESEEVLANSYGLNLKAKSNYFYYYLSIVCKQGEEIKSDGDMFLESDFSKFDVDELVKNAVEKTVSKFDGTNCKPQSYKCVLNNEVTSEFLNALINAGFSAENIQRKSSVLVGKLNEKVFSSKISVDQKPLEKNCFFSYFDDEGVATYNKKLIDKGVVKTYLYNLETARKDNVESTGNGYKAGAKIGIGASNLFLKPGKSSEEELFAKVGNGIYITSIAGLHSGMNAQSGDFSLEAEGFHIKDGKKAGPLTLITVGGNLYKMFADVLAVANNSKLSLNSVTASSIIVKGLKISSL